VVKASQTAIRPVGQPATPAFRARAMSSSRVSDLTHTQPAYAHLQRGEYAELTNGDVEFFEGVLPGRVIKGNPELMHYCEDWLRQYRGIGSVVLRPKTTEECSAVLKYCDDRRIAVTLQGGNTGLVGGSVPVFDEVVLSTSLMNKVESLDQVSNVLVCQSGCILEALEQYVADYGCIMPLDLGAKGSCQIGGNVSTNAGGLRFLRYGSLHASVLGLEVVKADGTVLDMLTTLPKNNTGYDLKQVFIGAEGTLGLVTKVAIKLPVKPHAVNLAFLGCNSFDDVLKTVHHAKSGLAEILSAFEFLDQESAAITADKLGIKTPIDEYPFYTLIETHGSVDTHDYEKLHSFLEEAMGAGFVTDGVVAQDSAQMAHFWSLREGITSALSMAGTVYKYDVSLPLTEFYNLVEAMRERVGDLAMVCTGYGHLGDGNLHLNIVGDAESPSDELRNAIEPFVYEYVGQHKGSISAEHGLGVMKAKHIHYSRSAEEVDVMRSMKAALDPKGILQPYKTLPEC